MTIFSIIYLLIIAYVSYYCLNRYDFKHVIIFNVTAFFIESIIGTIFFGNGSFIKIIIQPIVSGFVSSYLCSFVYDKSRTLLSYFIILIIIILAVTIVPVWIVSKSAQMVS